jgi:hypothetical protein
VRGYVSGISCIEPEMELLKIRPRDSSARWNSAAEVIAAAERLYFSNETELAPDETHRRVRDLVKTAGMRFVRAGAWNEAFRLLGTIQLPPEMVDAELFHLRNAVAVREQRRVLRVRRMLKLILLGVLVYLFCFSPTFFTRLENPHRIEMGLPELDWSEGLYWSVITSTTVGYGDVVPFTPYARLLALFNASLGVMLTGVIAGLILGLVTPRRM